MNDEERFNKLISSELSDEKGNFTYSLVNNSEFVKTSKTPDDSITLKKEVIGKKIKLTAKIRVPVIVKDTESIAWNKNMEEFLAKEVEKSWTITETLKGYEIPFTQIFYKYLPLPELNEVTTELETIGKNKSTITGRIEELIYGKTKSIYRARIKRTDDSIKSVL